MALLSALAFALLLVGTYLLTTQRYTWDAALLVMLSLAIFVGRQLASRGRWLSLHAHLKTIWPRHWAGWARCGAVALSLAVALGARNRAPAGGFAALFLLWVCAVAVFVAAVLVQARGRQSILGRFGRSELIALGVLLVIAGLARGLALERIPANLGGDEGTQLTDALNLVGAPMGNPFATGWYSVPTMSFLVYGLSMKVFGATVAGGRFLSVILGTLTVATTYLLGRVLSGKRVAWTAAAIVAFSAYHIHFSRLASNQIADPLIGTLTLWLVCRAWWPDGTRAEFGLGGREPGAGHALIDPPSLTALILGLAGAAAGLGWYAYFGARWVTLLVAIVVVWQCFVTPGFLRQQWRGLLFFAMGWLVVALPLLGWYAVHPSPLTERYNAVSIFASGWLAREVQITGKSAQALLLQQLWRSITAFHLTHDPTFWYFPQRPLLDFVTGALMLVGLVDALGRVRWPSRSLVLLWFGSTVVMAWALTENPPSSQRGLLMVPAVALLAAWGSDGVARSLARRRRLWWTGVLVAAIAILNGTFYFGVYTPRRIYGNPTAEIATAFARYTLAHPEPVCPQGATSADTCPGAIYFMGPPRLQWGFGTLSFMLRGFPGVDVAEEVVPPAVDRPARFAFVPERVTQLDTVRALYPGGVTEHLESPDGRLLMVIYDWPGPDA